MRIVSLVPSLTEFLFDLGLDDHIAGRTRFCIHPKKKVSDVPVVGGTKNPSVNKILALRPDLILANKEENRKEDIEALQGKFRAHELPSGLQKGAAEPSKSRFPDVLVTQIGTVDEALSEMIRIGQRCNKEQAARQITDEIHNLRPAKSVVPSIPAAYLIWREPWMSTGRDTYIHSVLKEWGFDNIFSDRLRYPVTSLEELRDRRPACILLSSEPYPFKERHLAEVSAAVPEAQVRWINGEWTSWYGSRMKIGFQEMKRFRNRLRL